MQKSMSLRATAKEVGISLATAFAWRHKILKSLENKKVKHNKVIQIQKVSLPFSEKGTRKKSTIAHPKTTSLFITDHSGNQQVLSCKSRLSKLLKFNKQNFAKQTVKEGKAVELKNESLQWLETFRGVASKYLQNYWNWQNMLLAENFHHIPHLFIHEILNAEFAYIKANEIKTQFKP